jgi:hypothetical protein
MWRHVLLCGVLAGVLAGCSMGGESAVSAGGRAGGSLPSALPIGAGYAAYCGTAGCPRRGVPPRLLRPLHLPQLAPGAPCPTAARPRRVTAKLGPMVGSGPAYVLSVFTDQTSLPFVYPPPKSSILAGSAWGGQKVF